MKGDTNELVLGTSIGFNLDQQSNGSHIYLPYYNGDSLVIRKLNTNQKMEIINQNSNCLFVNFENAFFFGAHLAKLHFTSKLNKLTTKVSFPLNHLYFISISNPKNF